ncbi:MAG: hypothetical protein WCE31_01080, partial [Priestia megaterium]
MIIVYISLAVVLASLAYLIYAGVSFNKKIKPTVNSVNATSQHLQNETDHIKEKTNHLKVTQAAIKTDVQYKKDSVKYT